VGSVWAQAANATVNAERKMITNDRRLARLGLLTSFKGNRCVGLLDGDAPEEEGLLKGPLPGDGER
jgi:hypothetical protein